MLSNQLSRGTGHVITDVNVGCICDGGMIVLGIKKLP